MARNVGRKIDIVDRAAKGLEALQRRTDAKPVSAATEQTSRSTRWENDPAAAQQKRAAKLAAARAGQVQVEPGPKSEMRVAFEKAVTEASIDRAKDVGQFANGAFGNVITALTAGAVGDGCSAWSDWLSSDLLPELATRMTDLASNGKVKKRAAFEMTHHEVFHIDSGAVNHNAVRVELKDGSKLVIDPWRNPQRPIWDESVYKKRFGKMYEGYGSVSEMVSRYGSDRGVDEVK